MYIHYGLLVAFIVSIICCLLYVDIYTYRLFYTATVSLFEVFLFAFVCI